MAVGASSKSSIVSSLCTEKGSPFEENTNKYNEDDIDYCVMCRLSHYDEKLTTDVTKILSTGLKYSCYIIHPFTYQIWLSYPKNRPTKLGKGEFTSPR